MAKTPTVSLALLEADAAIAVLESTLSDKLTAADRALITKAREALAIAEGRLEDARRSASDVASRL